MKEIQLNRKNKSKNFMKYKTMVDNDLYDKLNKFNYYLSKDLYAVRNYAGKTYRLHKDIMGDKEGFIIDHRDGNKLNNQKENLRFVTYQQNMFNRKSSNNSSSKFKGVCFCKRDKLWVAKATLNKKTHNLGYFKSELEAAKAYNEFAIKYHSDYANINFNI